MGFLRGVFTKLSSSSLDSKQNRRMEGAPGGTGHRGNRCSTARGAQGRGGKRGGRRGDHTELLTSVGKQWRRLVGVDQGRPVVVQGDSSAPASGGRRKRAELGQLGVLELVAGSAAPVGLHAGVSRSAAAGLEWPAVQSG
jgi:hypothetical protein